MPNKSKVPDPASLLAGPPASVPADSPSFLPVLGEEGWREARRLADLAKNFTRAGTAAKAMCGVVLRSIRQELYGHRSRKGGRPGKLESTWASMLADHVGISDECAANWMKMADAVEALAVRQREDIRDLLQKLPWDWTPEEAAALDAAVSRLTEGKTQRQLLQLEFWSDLGVDATPRSNPRNAAGKNQHGRDPEVPATPQAMREAMEGVARQWFTGTVKPGRMEPGSIAWHIGDFLSCLDEQAENPAAALTACALDNMPVPERKRFHDDFIAPFASAWRKWAGL